MGMLRYRALALVVGLLAITVIGCGGGDGDKPQAEDIPSGAVAVVGDAEVPKTALDRQVAVLRRAQRQASGEALTAAQREQVTSQALALLLQREAIEQEAAERGIEVSAADVRGRWRTAAREQFKTKQALRRFLRGQTVADILAQLRLQVLTGRINEQISERAGGGKQGVKAVEKFQKEFQQRWQDKTACATGYTATGCTTPNPR